ncbi:NAD(P)H-dependent flavin oxidoreductase [Ottowia thiooxydans]|uniref:NAD(P)H-dependent flavin oxidoreductase n=1 Tax=Ottowia thiooxydans TaxID=219182 RepID=UPI0004241845|nr:nitronate monooxygenase [Ottowia thiooxydans]
MIKTALTRLFDLRYPIVLAPMGGVTGGALAAAVSNAGGLGLVGGGYGDPDWLRTELALVRQTTSAPWGAGVITWAVGPEIIRQILAQEPHAVMLSFGDPRPYGEMIKAAGCKLICQVQDLAGALLAREAGADLIIAQGTEAGGHGSQRSTLALVPAVVDAVAPVPVLAAGGIADGRGLAAALMLGAQGVLIGTRFVASDEALGSPLAKERIVRSTGDQTARTTVFDIVRGLSWPEPHTGRALRNQFMARWHGNEPGLVDALAAQSLAFKQAQQSGDFDTAMVWAGEGVDLIQSVEPAGDIVRRIGDEAESRLSVASALVS